MSTIAVTYSFANSTPADASQVNQNFSDLVQYINANCVTKDAALAFTGVPSGPATDPTSANHLVRKAYFDQREVKNRHANYGLNGNANAGGTTLTFFDIADPGYNILVWGTGSGIFNPATQLDTANLWEMEVKINGVARAGLRIPVMVNLQSMAVAVPAFTVATGSGTGPAGAHRFALNIFRQGGAQATVFNHGPDPRYNFFDIFYKRV